MSIAILVYPIIIFAVALVVIAIYRSIYRNNMNRALEGEGTSGMMDLGQFIKMLVFLALIIMNVVALSRLGTVQNQLSNLQSNYNSLNSQLTSRISGLQNEMNDYFASKELVQSFDYELTDIDGNDALYNISFTLNEIEPNADVYLAIEGDLTDQILIQSSTLTFETDLVLQVDGSYTLNLLIEGDTIIQEELLDLDVEEMLEQAVTAQLYPDFWDEEMVEEGEEYIEKLQVQVVNLLSYIDSKQIDTVRFEISYEGVEMIDETLYTPTTVTDDMEVYKMYDDDVEAFVLVFEQGENDRWSEYEAKCTVTLTDGTILTLYAYL